MVDVFREGREFMIVDSSDEGSNMTSSGEGREYFMVSHWYVCGAVPITEL